MVIKAARESSEHAGKTEWREIGEDGLERFRADVVRLLHDYMVGNLFSVFREMYAVRRRISDALERRIWPRDANGGASLQPRCGGRLPARPSLWRLTKPAANNGRPPLT
ncbi:hypothetical protein ABZ801_31810 [Actinomadura sp. NPDC047616]|uniref:hypothetical protein n=1 Tax=Actinomadura sp. NPDC047616 TaxID=3155914 RepID=UPI0033CCBFE3